MSSKHFYTTVGVVFLVVAVVHFLRAMNGWPLVIGGYSVPIWLSACAVILGVFLSYEGLRR